MSGGPQITCQVRVPADPGPRQEGPCPLVLTPGRDGRLAVRIDVGLGPAGPFTVVDPGALAEALTMRAGRVPGRMGAGDPWPRLGDLALAYEGEGVAVAVDARAPWSRVRLEHLTAALGACRHLTRALAGA